MEMKYPVVVYIILNHLFVLWQAWERKVIHEEIFKGSSDLMRLLGKQGARWEQNITMDLKGIG
jgi:hypothetical protein